MNLKEWIAGGGLTLAAAMTLVQISPIKLDPWTWLGKLLRLGMKAVGRAFNADLADQVAVLSGGMDEMKADMASMKANVATVQEKVDVVQAAAEERAAIAARARILRFGDEVLHGVKHTQDHFESVLRDAQDYSDYCDIHPKFKNGVTEPTIQRIKTVYLKCLERHDFL